MISQREEIDLAARQRYAANLFRAIGSRCEESLSGAPGNSISLPHLNLDLNAEQFRLEAAGAAVEAELDSLNGSITLKYFAGDRCTHSCVAELKDCRYPWDCKVLLTGCEWLGLESERREEASPGAALNEHGEKIAAALMKKLFSPDLERVPGRAEGP